MNLNDFICILKNTKKYKFKIENTIYNIYKILFVLNQIYNNNDKDDICYIIFFESACIYMKKIIDIEQLVYKEDKRDLLLLDFNRIRNMTAHNNIKYRLKDKGIYFSDNLSRAKFLYNRYYINNDGSIDMILFIVYYLYIIVNKLIEKYDLNINSYNNISTNYEYEYILESINIFNSLTFRFDMKSIYDYVVPNYQINILWNEISALKVSITNNANFNYIKKEIFDMRNKILKIKDSDKKDLLLNQLLEIEKEFFGK